MTLFAIQSSLGAVAETGKTIAGTDLTTSDTFLPLNSALTLGGATTLVGLLVVFFALILLIMMIALQSGLLGAFVKKKKAPEPVAEPVTIAPPVAEEIEPEPVLLDVEDEDEIAAVISAALSMVCQAQAGEEKIEGFVVRSIKRVGVQAPAWSAAGRRENLWNR